MPYGVKRGVKAPGDYGIADIFGLSLAGSAGIIAALVTDFQQQGEASAIYTINQWAVSAGKMLGYGDIPLWFVVAGLIALGAASVFYFQPITRQGAFAQGFGLLAVIMTATPADLAGGLEAYARDGELPGLESISLQREASLNGEAKAARISHAAYAMNEGRVIQVQNTRRAAKYEVMLSINFTNGIPDEIDSMIRRGTIRGRLHNAQTGETYNLFRNAGGTLERSGDSLIIHAGVPARDDSATLWVRIEAVGYAIEEQSTQARLGQMLEWNIDLRPSNTPLFLQRLGKSYWY